jgi:hypothetical protein
MNPSISTIQTFIDCPLKFRLHHIVGLRKIEDESADHHLRFGAAMHKAMEVIYKAKMRAEECGHRFALCTSLIKEAKAHFLSAYPRQLDPNDNAKTQESGKYAIESYLKKYALEDARRWRVLAVEAPETYDNGFITHLDMVAEDLEHGGIYGFDFKFTKKALSYDFWSKFEPNSQIARYNDFIRSKYGSCEGFYIRATQFGYRSRAYKGEPAGFYVKHEAQLFNVNDDKIAMERESSRIWIDSIERATVLDEWPMNTDHCQWCQYRPICMAGWTFPRDEELITLQYRVVCNRMTATLRPCLLDVGHGGECSEQRAAIVSDIEIEVE